MIILPYKERFIQKHFLEFYSNNDADRLPEYSLFKKLNSVDQFYLAANYNWDDGIEILHWIIDSEKCDKGTASLIFWFSEPDFYISKTEASIPDYEKPVFELLQKITKKFNEGAFKKNNLKFDPGKKAEIIDWNKKYEGWEIPKELQLETKGSKLFSLGQIQMMIWNWKRARKLKKREDRRKKRNLYTL